MHFRCVVPGSGCSICIQLPILSPVGTFSQCGAFQSPSEDKVHSTGMITINAEEDLTVLRSPAIPYIDVVNNVAPDAFHTFEIVNANVIPEGSVLAKPKVSANDRMVAKVMLANGYKPDPGSRAHLRTKQGHG